MTQNNQQPRNLFDYFASKGQPLPSWKQRAPLFEQLGLGRESDYAGSESQNNKLLQALTTSGATVPRGDTAKSLAFGGTPPPASTSLNPQPQNQTGTQDVEGLLKQKLIGLLTGQGQNTEQLNKLQTQEQNMLRQQSIAPAYSQKFENILSPEAKLRFMRQRGSEMQPQLQEIQDKIDALKTGTQDKLSTLSGIADIATKLGMFGSKPPATLNTDQGILQWNKEQKKWEPTGYKQPQKATASGTKATPNEYKLAGFATRLVQSDSILNNLYKKLSQEGTMKQLWERNAPNIWTSDLMQQIQQAERNFLNAKLRQESGAAIGADEFTNGEKQYFITPGDSPAVIKQKEANRKLVLQNMIKSAGGAYGSQDNSQVNNDPLGIR